MEARRLPCEVCPSIAFRFIGPLNSQFRMYALLLVCVVFGTTSKSSMAAPAKTAATPDWREWSNASGSKHVRAVLRRIEGDKLWLRRSDGKLATATLAQLSDVDRHYVATFRGATMDNSQAGPK